MIEPSVKIKTVRERTSNPSQLAGIVAVAVPPLGLVIAVWLLWNRGVHPVDLALLAAFYAACGLGITVGFHRLTHRLAVLDERPRAWGRVRA